MGERARRPRLIARALRFTVLAVAVFGALLMFGEPLALAAIRVYQAAGAPLIARAGISCRLTPSCSRFAADAIARDGLFSGGWQALRRTGRCGWLREDAPPERLGPL
jgi:putative component of membrane protein insertase Oxa1/YidC/SpoIIIJ protein YidD